MSFAIPILVLLAVLTVVLFLRSRTVTPVPVLVGQIPDIVAQLARAAIDESWVVFGFLSRTNTAPDEVNLQYSVEEARVGLDWVLLSPTNIRDQGAIKSLAERRQHTVVQKTENGVSYLRIDNGDIAQLGIAITREIYGLDLDTKIEIVASDKFDWKP